MEGISPLFFDLCIQMIYMGLYPKIRILRWAITHKASLHEIFVMTSFSDGCKCSSMPFALGLNRACGLFCEVDMCPGWDLGWFHRLFG